MPLTMLVHCSDSLFFKYRNSKAVNPLSAIEDVRQAMEIQNVSQSKARSSAFAF